MLCKKL